jgi:hypothetical protein
MIEKWSMLSAASMLGGSAGGAPSGPTGGLLWQQGGFIQRTGTGTYALYSDQGAVIFGGTQGPGQPVPGLPIPPGGAALAFATLMQDESDAEDALRWEATTNDALVLFTFTPEGANAPVTNLYYPGSVWTFSFFRLGAPTDPAGAFAVSLLSVGEGQAAA